MAPAWQKIMRSMLCSCALPPPQCLSLILRISLDNSYT